MAIQNRIDMKAEFNAVKKKQISLWGTVLSKMKTTSPFSELDGLDIKEKVENLKTSYKRIKERNNESGREATIWEFFGIFDEAYGGRHGVFTPQKILFSMNLLRTKAFSKQKPKENARKNNSLIF